MRPNLKHGVSLTLVVLAMAVGDALYGHCKALEQGTVVPFPTQLSELYSIVGIESDPDDLYFALPEIPQRSTALQQPLDDWGLRLLLKRFNTQGDITPDSPSVNILSWILFRKLVGRLPVSLTAEALKDHDFQKIIEKTLLWLNSATADELPALTSEKNTIGAKELPRYSSKKRGNGKHQIAPIPCQNGDDSAKHDPYRVFIALCSALRELRLKIREAVAQDEDLLAERLKLPLRAPHGTAARILGASLQIVVRIVTSPALPDAMKGPFESLVAPFLDIWSYRIRASDDYSGLAQGVSSFPCFPDAVDTFEGSFLLACPITSLAALFVMYSLVFTVLL